MVSGESHYFLGHRYRLRVHEHEALARLEIRGLRMPDLYVRPGSAPEKRMAVLQDWYRVRLRERIPPLAAKWQKALGVQARHWSIKK